MHSVPSWPRPNELVLPQDPQNRDEYFRSLLLWGSENGADEVVFLSLEEWPPKKENLLEKDTLSIRENFSLPKDRKLSLLLPPILLGNSLAIWTEESKSLVHSFFGILDKLISVRKHASELLGYEFSSEPKLVWKEEIGVPNSVLLTDTLWEKKSNGKRVSTPLAFSQTFFLGSLFGIENIESIEWIREGESETEAAVSDFIRARAKAKYGNIFSALGEVSQTETWEYRPHVYLSFPFHMLIQIVIVTEAWDQLVSLWIEERPKKENALDKLKEWAAKESGSQTLSGFEALFEERTVRLVDKYCERSDRFLLQRLEWEYFNWKNRFESQSLQRRQEIDETLIPSILARVAAHSRFSWPEELQSQWEEIGKIHQKNLENLLLERKNLPTQIPELDGKTPESWNILLSHRSE